MNLTEWSKEVNKTATEHGWHEPDKEPSFGEVVALCHSELSEALQAYREGQPNYYWIQDGTGHNSGKPDGVAVEMADCLIRILDWAGQNGIDMESIVKQKDIYNKSRPYRHGGKKL
ncbi:MAG: hypothetical protein E7572_05195 [Ruminococcaceae bacterium]|jgi:NTP pyrophosphatase (non-canonical NTP hydrolase)|nr:hypothetical protein [Oscillospiraceae bacterium]